MFVNGEFIDDGLVRIEAARIKKEEMRARGEIRDELGFELEARELARNIIIERTVLRQAAQKDSTPIPPEAMEAELQQYREQSPEQARCQLPRDWETLRAKIETDLRIQRFIDHLTASLPKPGNQEIAALYNSAKQRLTIPESIHAAHIVKNVDESQSEDAARAAIEQIQTLLQQGTPFEKVADEHSDCPGRGGDLGFFMRGDMVEEFDAAVFDLPAGSVSPIFRTPFGFHIAKVYERHAPRVPSLKEARTQLEKSLWQHRQLEAVRAYVTRLREQAEVRRSK